MIEVFGKYVVFVGGLGWFVCYCGVVVGEGVEFYVYFCFVGGGVD